MTATPQSSGPTRPRCSWKLPTLKPAPQHSSRTPDTSLLHQPPDCHTRNKKPYVLLSHSVAIVARDIAPRKKYLFLILRNHAMSSSQRLARRLFATFLAHPIDLERVPACFVVEFPADLLLQLVHLRREEFHR